MDFSVPVYSVNLVSLSEVLQERKAQSAIARRKSIKTISGEHASVLKKRADAVPAVPIKRLDSQRKQTSSVDRAIEDIRRKVNTGVSPPAPAGQADNAAGIRHEDECLLQPYLVPDQGKMDAASGNITEGEHRGCCPGEDTKERHGCRFEFRETLRQPIFR